MFTGIIEEVGKVVKIQQRGENRRARDSARRGDVSGQRAVRGGRSMPPGSRASGGRSGAKAMTP